MDADATHLRKAVKISVAAVASRPEVGSSCTHQHANSPLSGSPQNFARTHGPFRRHVLHAELCAGMEKISHHEENRWARHQLQPNVDTLPLATAAHCRPASHPTGVAATCTAQVRS